MTTTDDRPTLILGGTGNAVATISDATGGAIDYQTISAEDFAARLLADGDLFGTVLDGRDTAAIDDVVRELRSMGTDATAAVADCTDADALARARERV